MVAGLIPALEAGTVVAVDGKTSRRSGGEGRGPLHLVSALALASGWCWDKRPPARNPTNSPRYRRCCKRWRYAGLSSPSMHGTHASIAEVIPEQGADYVLAVKDNQPYLAESMREFFATGQAMTGRGWPTTTTTARRSWAHRGAPLLRLRATGVPGQPEQWPDSRCSGWCAERTIKGEAAGRSGSTSAASPCRQALCTRGACHWEVDRLHWCLDVCLNDDQARARVKNSARTLPPYAAWCSIFCGWINPQGWHQGRRMIAAPVTAIASTAGAGGRGGLMRLPWVQVDAGVMFTSTSRTGPIRGTLLAHSGHTFDSNQQHTAARPRAFPL